MTGTDALGAAQAGRTSLWAMLLAAVALAVIALAPPTAGAQSAACPCTVFDPADGPLGLAVQDAPVEVGMKIRSSQDGFITALRFYKQANNTGVHVGHLWTSSGQQLAEVTFSGETESGWQREELPEPVPIQAGTTYVVSYYAAAGRFAFHAGYFTTGTTREPLTAPADGLAGGQGVYRYGPTSSFPDQSWNATNYWVDAEFQAGEPPDERAPGVQSFAPADGATGVPAGADVTARFDEPLDPLTVNNGSFNLRTAGGTPVTAAVTYDEASRTARIDPTEPLAYGTRYTATLTSGNAGVTDLAGNRFAQDLTWSFTTSPACPCTVFRDDQGPSGDAASDRPLEVGMKLRSAEDGYITALRFYKQPNNAGPHTGHLWSAAGQLLASARFVDETPSGWQRVELPNPVRIAKDTTYVTSYYSSSGHFPAGGGYFAQGTGGSVLRGLANGEDGGNGVYRYGASGFPTDTFNASNYWVDAEFQRTAPPDNRPPTIVATDPAADASDVPRDAPVTATFDEPLASGSVTSATVTLRDADGALVPAAVSYDDEAHRARIVPAAPLRFGGVYTARIAGGSSGVTDTSGNALAADRAWSFTVARRPAHEGPGGPVLVVGSPADRFPRYLSEILRAEGLNAFEFHEGEITAGDLAGHTAVVLGAVPVSDAEVALLSDWVAAGGNLIAMRPDAKLAPLLGLAPAGGTLADAYLKVDASTEAGAGIEDRTLQFHGAADRYTLAGATAIASLYSDASTATAHPAVTLRAVGTAGGQAAAFTYDLARSVIYTRQGNPAWAGQKRDGTINGIRPDDLFYGAKTGDVRPDWTDPARVEVPQADEQQRLLANLLTTTNLDRAPLPRFWYLPRGEKAAIVLTADDHDTGGTVPYLDRLRAMSPDGCSVQDWECIRATSYLFTNTPLSDAQAASYQDDGFELGLHLNTGCQDFTPQSLEEQLAGQLSTFAARWPSLRAPVTNRTHCVIWSDWATQPKVERAHGIRFDTNYYYHGPDGWLTRPGLLTGAGFPQRFADLDGSLIDAYQATTQVTDESQMAVPYQVTRLLDGALGPEGRYGAFTVLTHADLGDHDAANSVVGEARERGVPVVSSRQMLDWIDGRNASSFGDLSWSGDRLTFTVSADAGIRGLEAMLPEQSAAGPLATLTRDGVPVARSTRTVKGVRYVVFKAAGGSYSAGYATDAIPPAISAVSATADGEGRAVVTWETDEPSTSTVSYGRRPTSLWMSASETAPTTEHRVELRGLVPQTTYSFRVTSADAAGNTADAPAAPAAPLSFSTPAGELVDTRTAEFAAGTASGAWVGATRDGEDGEVQLRPAAGSEFDGAALPDGWLLSPWAADGSALVAGGRLTVNSGAVMTSELFEAPRTLEFVASLPPVHDVGIGFSNTFADYPWAAFTTGRRGDSGFEVIASTAASETAQESTRLPGVSLDRPHRFRIDWSPTSVRYVVDGVTVATHAVAIDRTMRPVVSDYQPFGSGVGVEWLRQSAYASSGTLTSRVLDSGPAGGAWQTLSSTADVPAGTGVAFETRSGSSSTPDASWSAWQPAGAGGAIASPTARYLQYRATLTGPADGSATATLERVAVSFGASGNGAPQEGTANLTPSAPRTTQTVTVTPAGFSDPDGDPLSYRYRWLRNDTVIEGATSASLNLATPGYGDRGDRLRVEVTAVDARGGASDPAIRTVVVANSPPAGGSVSLRPLPLATDDVAAALPASFSDADGDPLVYRYQWLRNGTAIPGATDRTLDLDLPGNGNLGDSLGVQVRAEDDSGAQSPVRSSTRTISSTNAAPVVGTAAITPTAPGTADVVTATPSGFREPDGNTISYRYQWLRNGTAISGATGATLNLAGAGAGDRGDQISVTIVGTDGSKSSEAATARVTVVNTPPAAGTVTLKPTAPSSDDPLTATIAGWSDADGDPLQLRYRWLRNGVEIAGETERTLDLSKPGNGDVGDVIESEVSATDGSGGASATVRTSRTIAGSSRSPVVAYGFEEATGTAAFDESGPRDGVVQGATRTAAGKFGRALSFDGVDDEVTVESDPSLQLTGAVTVSAWVRPAATADWRTIAFKESAGGPGYGLYANGDEDTASFHATIDGPASGEAIVRGSTTLDANAWTFLAGTYDGTWLRLYLNGREVAARKAPGELASGPGPLTFGANNIWGEAFKGVIDEVRVYDRALTPAELEADLARPVVAGTPLAPDDTSPASIGRFSAPQTWPIVAVHLAMTSDGKVAAWDGFDAAVNSERRWDPATASFERIPNGRNLFCAGHITLQDGRLLVAGGHIQAYEGLKDTNLFTPATKTWARGADMQRARWYPTATMLSDGRVFVTSGDQITRGQTQYEVPLRDASETLPEIYDPATDTWTPVTNGQRRMPLYPFIFLLPDGRLFDAGPDRTTRTLNLSTGSWTTAATSQVDGHSAVMYRPGRILKSGTWSDPEFPGRTVSAAAQTINMTSSSPAWTSAGAMNYGRAYHTLTALPDGTVLATGGQDGTDGVDERTGVLASEIWDPATNRWRVTASQSRPRLYHSSALLLPDGRVLLAGGGAFGTARDEKSAEIYSPPYLFKGDRPWVSSAPDEVHYGQSFRVESPDAGRVSKVSFVRMGSVTHNVDMDQRYMELSFSRSGDNLTISGPANANTAPPGFYMVFLVDSNGVPSQGQIVKVDPAADRTAPSAPTGFTAVGQTTAAQLNWNASSDNVKVAEYRVHRSTTSGFTPSAANRVARVRTGTSYRDTDLAAGTYHYRVTAVDTAGNVSANSAQATANVTADGAAPTVSVTAPASGATVQRSIQVTANASDDVAVKSVQFRLDGADLGAPVTAAPYAMTWDTRAATNGPHTLTAVARDGAGNTRTSATVNVTVANAAPPGLVAAYGFEEAGGTTAVDAAYDHDGLISGATRVAGGKFGRGLSFDGIDDTVTVTHHSELSATRAVTVSAWVRPTTLGGLRAVVSKEQAAALAYALYASAGANGAPTGTVFTDRLLSASSVAAVEPGAWSHLTMTWDGLAVRLYVDGDLVASRDAPGTLPGADGPLRIGASAGVSTGVFSGVIDEVRVYDRVLSAAEVAADMAAPVSP